MAIEDHNARNKIPTSENSDSAIEKLIGRLLNLGEADIAAHLKDEKDTRIIYQAGQLIDSRIRETPKGDPMRLKLGVVKRCLNERRKSIMHVGVTRASMEGRVEGKKTEFNV
jgi:hypothetical protein